MALRPKIYETCLDSLEVGRLVGFLFPTVDSLICYFRSNSDVDHFKYPQWGFRSFVGAHKSITDHTILQSAPSGQFKGLIKSFHGNSAGQSSDTTAAVQPGVCYKRKFISVEN